VQTPPRTFLLDLRSRSLIGRFAFLAGLVFARICFTAFRLLDN
jgi:hypothetical protein